MPKNVKCCPVTCHVTEFVVTKPRDSCAHGGHAHNKLFYFLNDCLADGSK